jgi:two-component system sensor histidine kinase BaeS
MTKKLSFRISALLMLWSGTILLIASIAIVNATHYHFQLYGKEAAQMNPENSMLNGHLEQAIIQSVILTIIFSLILAILLSVYIARRISTPLVRMKQAALSISQGDLETRIQSRERNEMSDLGQALNHLAEQLQKQQGLRVAMTENIAHELRTPLTTIKSFLSAMKDGIWEPTKYRLESCLDEINRLVHLVDDLEQLNEMSSPDFHLEQSEVSLRDHLEKVIQRNEAAFMERSIELQLGFVPDFHLFWDENRMMQVWNNLLSNALKFVPSGGKVTIEAEERDDFITVKVTDTGKGIPENDALHIFDRFYRVDKSRSRRTGGGGLGLAITRSIVEAHSGRIMVKNQDHGEGTVFYLQFPILPVYE